MVILKRKKEGKMKQITTLLNALNEKLFSSNYQLQRIVILMAVALVLAVVSFGGYYYYDRYYSSQPTVSEVSIEDAEKAVRDDPQSVDARIALAETYMINGRFEDALTNANQVLSLEPDNQHAWLVAGISYANTGKPAEAIDPLTEFVDARKEEDMPGLDKQLQAAAYFLGDCYLQLGKPQEAIVPLESAVKWSRTDADSMYKLGLAYSGAQEYEKAADMFHAATTFVPDFLEAYQGLEAAYTALNMPGLAIYAHGMIAYSQKDYESARDILLESTQMEPNYAPTFAGLGRIYESLNDLPNAKASYETALKIDVNDFTASNGLQRVEAMMKK
jgi:tetratricopeptide (TPR) repeat protein